LVRRFWRSFISLVLFLIVVDVISWFYIVTHLTLQVASGGLLGSFVLPVDAPSVWSFIQPGITKNWLAPLIVLVAQVWLTGGFYGTLVRMNTSEAVSPTNFVFDGFRSFGKLLLWNLLWAAAAVAVVGLNRALPAFGPALFVLLLVLRFVFLFGNIGLVAERDARYALRLAASLLLSRWLTMLPYAIVLVFLADVARRLSGIVSGVGILVIAALYTVMAAWVLHMVTARYLAFSGWSERRLNMDSLAES
jgi:hypothetical protein